MNTQLWKKAFQRALIGMPIGVTISTVITIIISLCKGDGHYYAVVPALTADLGSESCAVLIQFLCSLLYGAVFAGVFQRPLTLVSDPLDPRFDALKADPEIYFGIFLAIYLVIWIIEYTRMRKGVDDLNRKMRGNA